MVINKQANRLMLFTIDLENYELTRVIDIIDEMVNTSRLA